MPRRSRLLDSRVHVSVRGGPFEGVHSRTLKRRALKMLDELALQKISERSVELSLSIVDDECIRETVKAETTDEWVFHLGRQSRALRRDRHV